MSPLARKVAFITGSGKKRLGNAVALEAARRGFDVALHYRTSKAEADATAVELRSLGVRVECFAADLREPKEVMGLCNSVIETFGRVDLLVTAAAIWKTKKLEETKPEDVLEHFTINTLGTFLCCQQIGLQMCKQASGGAIVCLGDWAIARPYDNFSAYFLSKGAIPTMTVNLANELAHRNPKVRVNCIHPGAAMVPENMQDVEKRGIVEKSLVKSLGSPEHIAQAVFSLYDNPYITGICLPVDGGEGASNT